MKKTLLTSILFLCVGGAVMAQERPAVKASAPKVAKTEQASKEKISQQQVLIAEQQKVLATAPVDVDPRSIQQTKKKAKSPAVSN